jgi:two-component system, sensor histidine kinase and response regulator
LLRLGRAREMIDSKDAGLAIDFSIALAHVENDLQLLAELAALFVQDYPRLRQESRNAIALNDCPGLERAAHTLKGRLAFFGIKALREQALQLETMGRANDLQGAKEALAAIEAAMERILPEIESLTKEI